MNESLLTSLLEDARTAVRIKIHNFDTEITHLIQACVADLILHNAAQPAQFLVEECDPLLRMAIITFVRANYGTPENPERLKADYDEQKQTLMMASGYTNWEA